MKSLSDYVTENDSTGLLNDPVILNLNKAEASLNACNLLVGTINNWDYYCRLHISGNNKQKFSPKVITQFRKNVAEVYSGSDSEIIASDIKEFAKKFHDEVTKFTANDFEGTKKCIADNAREITGLLLRYRKNFDDANEAWKKKFDSEK